MENNLIDINHREHTDEILYSPRKGFLMLLLNFLLLFAGIGIIIIFSIDYRLAAFTSIGAVCVIISLVFFFGFFTNNPNEAVSRSTFLRELPRNN